MYYFMLGVLPLPIPPSSLEITTPSMNTTVTLINDGEINIPKTQGLREISFEFLLPTVNKYPFSMYHVGNYTAVAIIEYIKRWKDSQYPLPFIVVRMSPAGKFLYFTSIFTLIEDFTFKEDAEEHGLDTLCSIKLKEYKGYATRRLQVKENSDGTKTATVKKERSTADRVKKSEIKPKKGETLKSAARREGHVNYSEVYEVNGIKEPTINYEATKELIIEDINPGTWADELSGMNNNIDKTIALEDKMETLYPKASSAMNTFNNSSSFVQKQFSNSMVSDYFTGKAMYAAPVEATTSVSPNPAKAIMSATYLGAKNTGEGVYSGLKSVNDFIGGLMSGNW